jgi:hypothetical protein
MFLKLKELGSNLIPSRGICLITGIQHWTLLGCYGLYTTIYLLFFRVFWFLYFYLFQVKVQLVSKWMMDYTVICFWIVDFDIGMKLDLVVMFYRLFLR